MFAVGENVIYPMHGAGTIEKIEDKTILGETRAYYIVKTHYGRMQVMVPVEGSEAAGLRSVESHGKVQEVLRVLGAESTPMDENWNRRNRDNMEKLKTGDLCGVAEVIRNLTRVDRVKKLSTGEKKLLTSAKQILISEMIIIENIDEEKAADMIESAI